MEKFGRTCVQIYSANPIHIVSRSGSVRPRLKRFFRRRSVAKNKLQDRSGHFRARRRHLFDNEENILFFLPSSSSRCYSLPTINQCRRLSFPFSTMAAAATGIAIWLILSQPFFPKMHHYHKPRLDASSLRFIFVMWLASLS
jgi:hypothetical protein